jgi:hypothetical protein
VPYKIPIKINKEGIWALFYYGEDFVGNKSPVYKKILIVDNTKPEVSLKHIGVIFKKNRINYVGTNTLFSFFASDNLSGIKEIKYSVNSRSFKIWNGEFFSLKNKGINRIIFNALDNALNYTGSITNVFFADTDSPVSKLSFAGNYIKKDNYTYIVNKKTTVTITATDRDSGVNFVEVILNNNKFIYDNSPLHFLNGTNRLEYTVSDKTGNVYYSPVYIIIKDAHPPVLKIIKK